MDQKEVITCGHCPHCINFYQHCFLKLKVKIRCAAPVTDPGDQTRCWRHKQVSPWHCQWPSSCLAYGHFCYWPIWSIVINGLIITIMEFPQGRKLANIVVTQASIRLKFIFKILSITEVFNLVSKFEIKLLKWKLVQIWFHLSFQVLPREKLSDNFLAMHHPKMLPGVWFLANVYLAKTESRYWSFQRSKQLWNSWLG